MPVGSRTVVAPGMLPPGLPSNDSTRVCRAGFAPVEPALRHRPADTVGTADAADRRGASLHGAHPCGWPSRRGRLGARDAARPISAARALDGQPATEATEVRILYDDDALYFGILCLDRSAATIVSTQLTRDADLDVDDRLTIVLDPFFDHRNGFFFQINPAGAPQRRADPRATRKRLTRDWDGIWSAASRRTGQGWIAEIAIPFKTLRFKPGQPCGD